MLRSLHKRLTAAMNAIPEDVQDNILLIAEDCARMRRLRVCDACLHASTICEIGPVGLSSCTCPADAGEEAS